VRRRFERPRLRDPIKTRCVAAAQAIDREEVAMPTQIRLLSEMIHRLGLDAAGLSSRPPNQDLATAVHACATCTAAETCATWLAQTKGPIDRAPDFCPNAELFKRARGSR
jgi:hypothetical protein